MLSKVLSLLKLHYRANWVCLIFVGLLVTLVMMPMPLLGIPDGYDLFQHLRFAVTFHEAILNGDFFPGWGAADNYGFGSIGIRYYPPVSYYLMAFTQMLTKDWFDTFWINSFFWMYLGCAGVYFWAKEWLSSWQSVVAVIVFLVVPYHTLQIYEYVLYSEFAALGILPFCFLFVTRIVRRNRFIDVILFSISFSLLLLTHIPLTIIGSIGLGIYTLLLIDWRQPKKTIVNFIIAFSLSLSATVFHWLRAVTEVGLVKHNSPEYYATGAYDYTKYFFPLIYSSYDKYVPKMLWLLDISVVFSILLILPLIIYLILQVKSNDKTRHSERKALYAFSVTGLFSIFIMSVPSYFIWNAVPILQKIQFPWRWLSLTALIGAMSFTFAFFQMISRSKNFKKPIIYAGLLLILAMPLFDFTQFILFSEPLTREKFAEKVAEMPREEGCDCWWTVWTKKEVFDKREKVDAASRFVNINRWDSESREFIVGKGASVTIRIATFYHPHWKAEVNGQAVEVQKDDDGSILIPVSDGESSVKLYFQEPIKLNIALGISLITWTFLLGALFAAYLNIGKFKTTSTKID
jgi:uncharacterized membrane protein